jgi:hypothetical protein
LSCPHAHRRCPPVPSREASPRPSGCRPPADLWFSPRETDRPGACPERRYPRALRAPFRASQRNCCR